MEDSSRTVPRRWTTEVEGIKWIPRMADKAHMRNRGVLGNYLMGHSPVDESLLHVLKMSTEEWVALVTPTSSDEEVLGKLRERGLDEEKLRSWSASFENRFKKLIPLWDIDEGYVERTPGQKIALTLFKPVEGLAMGLVRKMRKAP